MNKGNLLIILGSFLLLSGCVTPKDNDGDSPVITERESESTKETNAKASTTPIYLEDYLLDAEHNNLREISIQKYLSLDGNQVLTRSSDSIILLTFEDELLIETNIINPVSYLYPYREEEASLSASERGNYTAHLNSGGWYDEKTIFISTDKQVLLYHIEDKSTQVISEDFRPAYAKNESAKYTNWVSRTYAIGDYLVYQASRAVDYPDSNSQIFLGSTTGEEMILEDYSITLTNEYGFAYTDGNYGGGSFYGSQLWWYDIETKESHLIFEVEEQNPNLAIGDYNGNKQSYYDNPDLKLKDGVLQFYVTDLSTNELITHEYDTVNHTLIK